MQSQGVDFQQKWYVMIAVGMGIFLATVDGSIVNIALPTLVRELNADFPTVQWVVLGYLLTLTSLMLGIGRLADMRGKKTIYTTGFIVFTAGSVLCGLSPSIYWLIGFRVLQAIGASMIISLGMAIVTEAFPPSERGRALGISGAVVSIGIVVGPTLGGLLIESFSWRWIFFVNLPAGILGTLIVLRFVPSIKPAGGQRFDYWGALTLFISLLSLLLALTWGQRIGFSEPRILLLLTSWAITLAVFLLIEWHSPHPMIDLRLFRNQLFSVSLLTGFATFIAIAGTVILMPFYLENVLGYGTRQVGLLLAIVPIALGITAPISGSLSDRFGTRPITVIGLLILLSGYSLLGTLSEGISALGFIIRFLPIGIGMGVFQSPNNSAIMGTASQSRLGVVSGMLAITRSLGQTTGIALLAAFWSARLFHHADALTPGDVAGAPPAAQVSALADTFSAVVLLIAVAFVLAVWGLLKARQEPSGTALPSKSST